MCLIQLFLKKNLFSWYLQQFSPLLSSWWRCPPAIRHFLELSHQHTVWIALTSLSVLSNNQKSISVFHTGIARPTSHALLCFFRACARTGMRVSVVASLPLIRVCLCFQLYEWCDYLHFLSFFSLYMCSALSSALFICTVRRSAWLHVFMCPHFIDVPSFSDVFHPHTVGGTSFFFFLSCFIVPLNFSFSSVSCLLAAVTHIVCHPRIWLVRQVAKMWTLTRSH